MAGNVYKTIELTGTSEISMEDAVNQAIARARSSVRHMRWFNITETRGTIVEGQVGEWQVTIKVGFKIED